MDVSEKGDFGFISYDRDERIFFHISNLFLSVRVGDKVLFSIAKSKRKEGALEALKYVKSTSSKWETNL